MGVLVLVMEPAIAGMRTAIDTWVIPADEVIAAAIYEDALSKRDRFRGYEEWRSVGLFYVNPVTGESWMV